MNEHEAYAQAYKNGTADREKLIELIQSAVDGCATYWAGLIADHLIANGVTVLHKVGDNIFEADPEHGVVKHEIYEVCVVYKTTATDDKGAEWDDYWTSDDIGTADMTRKEAEDRLT